MNNKVPKLIKMTVIKSRIRRGDVTKVANKTGYSISHVSRVLRGERNNKFILSTAYTMTYRRVRNIDRRR